MIETPSPNFDDRTLPVSILVLHYTGMPDAQSAINWMANPDSKVSAHYVVTEEGKVVRMVDETKRAWHAGRAWWRGITDINSASIGIEIVNPGHEWGYRPFPQAQIDALIPLVHDIMQRHRITRGNVVGHSDVAPVRKQDPGELFPWSKLARLRLALPRPTRNLMDPLWSDGAFMLALERFGYDIAEPEAAVTAFQRRFRPELIDGVIDGECRAILLALLLPRPRGDD
ncbi:N-acetylmuramoyl-L-alanine amidase [Sphingobium sp. B11D3B]|uniref:N-acetylmuramoyl-L-alanine amidase n=1 Tax=Sphingobium sp. B11D3B TaxID=2940575 RepID=UPI0022275FCB|nr:N-acetylmuramoyl-L-alanine amidase [Sphingobium sp. B11D3B]MCW2389824.1 N-acetylmuramoyl-L-alanine amidase [Sphingobium sp. B11D3B]